VKKKSDIIPMGRLDAFRIAQRPQQLSRMGLPVLRRLEERDVYRRAALTNVLTASRVKHTQAAA